MNPLNVWILLTARSPGVNILPSGFGALTPSDVAHALQGLDRLRFLTGMATLGGDYGAVEPLIRHFTVHVVDIAETLGWESRRGSQACRSLAALAVYEFLFGERCISCLGTGQHRPAPPEPGECTGWPEIEHRRRSLVRLRKLEFWASVLRGEYASPQHARFAERAKAKLRPRTAQDRSRAIRRITRQIERYTETTRQLTEPMPCRACKGRGQRRITAVQRAWAVQITRQHWHQQWQSRYESLLHELEGFRSDCLTHLADHMEGRAA